MPDESTSMGEPSFPIQKPNAAEGEFMSNAAIGCLSFGAEHSFGSSLFKRVTQTLLETFAFGSHNFFRGAQTVREEFS